MKRRRGFLIAMVVLLIITISIVAKYKSVYKQDFQPTGPITADVRGRVLGTDGKPVGGATVYYVTKSPDSRVDGARITARARTNEDGSFALKNLRGCDWGALVAYKRGKLMGCRFGPYWSYMLPKSIENISFDITAHRLQIVKGRVVTDENEPVAGADVRVEDIRYDSAYLPYEVAFAAIGPQSTRTDGKGAFVLRDMPEGVGLRFDVRKPGYGIKTKGCCEAPYRVVMTKAGVISGRILTADRKPLCGATVFCNDSETDEQLIATRTDKNGCYRLELAPGRYQAEVSSATHYIHETKLLTVFAGCNYKTDLRAYPFAYIKGQVLDSATGLPVRDVAVESMWWSGGGYSGPDIGKTITVKADDQGRFSAPVPPRSGFGARRSEFDDVGRELNAGYGGGNPYYRSLGHDGVGNATEHGISGMKLLLDRVQLVRGIVVDTKDRPVSGAIIKSNWGMMAASGADGSFVMPKVADDVVCIKGSSRWHNVKSTIARVNKTTNCIEPSEIFVHNQRRGLGSFTQVRVRHLSGYRLVVQPASTLRVLLKDKAGLPIKGARVTANVSYGCVYSDEYKAVSNARGEAVISGLYAGGECSLSCSASNYQGLKKTLAEVGSKDWRDNVVAILRK